MNIADQSGVWALIRFLLGCESGHPHFQILSDFKHWSLFHINIILVLFYRETNALNHVVFSANEGG